MSKLEGIIALLEELQISCDIIDHPESHSCDESKAFRDTAGLTGAGSKNIVFHAKGECYLVTTLAEKPIRARNFKKEFGTKDIRFASQEEITAFCGSIIGSVPPFGFDPLVPQYVDREIFDHEFFLFNPDIATKSIRIKTQDLLRVYEGMGVKFFDDRGEVFEVGDWNQ